MRKKLLAIFAGSDTPWLAAQVYEGREYWADGNTIDFLLDRLEIDLRQALESERPDREPHLQPVLGFVARFRTAPLLTCFRRKKRQQLEELLVRYLRRVGPQRGSSSDGSGRDQAIEILHRLSGSGFSEVINAFLEAAEGLGLREAVHWAAKREDKETIRLLSGIATSNDESERASIVQADAAKALADFGRWEPVIAFVERVGLESDSRLMNWPHRDVRPDSSLLVSVRQRASEQTTAGKRVRSSARSWHRSIPVLTSRTPV